MIRGRLMMALSISSQIQGWRRVPGASRTSKSAIPVKIRLRCDIAIREEVGLGHLKVKGKLHDKGDIPFETAGIIASTADRKLRLHNDKIKAMHIQVKGLLDLFAVDLGVLMKEGKVPGVGAQNTI